MWFEICADKAANIIDMCHWLERGYTMDSFTSRGYSTQLGKFEALDVVYRRKIGGPVYERFRRALEAFCVFTTS